MRPRLRKLRVVRPARLGPREGLGSSVDEVGPCWAPFEPRRRPQVGKSGDPCSQNADTVVLLTINTLMILLDFYLYGLKHDEQLRDHLPLHVIVHPETLVAW